jgi:hypothetical protein
VIAATVALPWQRPPARRLERPAGSPPQRPCLKQHPDARLCTGQLVCRAGGRQFYGRRESEPIRYGRQRAATGSFAGELRPEPCDVHQSVNVHPLTIARSTAWLEPRAALSTGRRGGFSGSERRRARSVRHTSTAHGRGETGLGPASPDRARARPRSRPGSGGELIVAPDGAANRSPPSRSRRESTIPAQLVRQQGARSVEGDTSPSVAGAPPRPLVRRPERAAGAPRSRRDRGFASNLAGREIVAFNAMLGRSIGWVRGSLRLAAQPSGGPRGRPTVR